VNESKKMKTFGDWLMEPVVFLLVVSNLFLSCEAFRATNFHSKSSFRESHILLMVAKGGGDDTKIRGPEGQPPRPNDNTYCVTDSFIASEYPTDTRGNKESRNKIRGYLDLGIAFFVDLTREGEKRSYKVMLKKPQKSTWRLDTGGFLSKTLVFQGKAR
jgi:hypothetical protein